MLCIQHASTQTSKQHKTMNRCGAVCTAASPKRQRQCSLPINGKPKVVEPLMYKTIMRLATLVGNTTVTALRANLRELTQYPIKQNGNIDKIHTYFNQNYVQLKAQGQSINHVHTILFDTYLQGVVCWSQVAPRAQMVPRFIFP